jgi:hypothetical protein
MSEPDPAPNLDSDQAIDWDRSEVAEVSRRIDALFRATSGRVAARDSLARWFRESTTFRAYKADFLHEWSLLIVRHVRTDEVMRNFAVAFLEVDPYHFNSGYFKTGLLRRLRNCTLSTIQRARLLAVLRDAVMRRPRREYRDYCQLAVCIADESLLRDLERWSACAGAFGSRARMMLEIVRQG